MTHGALCGGCDGGDDGDDDGKRGEFGGGEYGGKRVVDEVVMRPFLCVSPRVMI